MAKKKNKAFPKTEQKKAASKDNRFLKAVLLFCLLAVSLNLAAFVLARGGHLHFLEVITAKAAGGASNLSGCAARINGNMIYLMNATWLVNRECTALAIMLIYASFILSYPASWKGKGAALLAGIPFIFGANVLRLLIMAWIDRLRPEFSTYFHDYLWQVAFIIMIVFMWLFWINLLARYENKTPVSA